MYAANLGAESIERVVSDAEHPAGKCRVGLEPSHHFANVDGILMAQ